MLLSVDLISAFLTVPHISFHLTVSGVSVDNLVIQSNQIRRLFYLDCI